jgi:glycerol-3-phosphate dehydrogenase
VRSLYDDGSARPQDVTRDYKLELDPAPGPRLLSVFGGKLTTARALAEEALARLEAGGRPWTAAAPLPGGERGGEARLRELAPWLDEAIRARLVQAYGTRLERVLGGAASMDGLGRHFGAGLYEAEVRYLVENEFARTAEDVAWRRTKLGLSLSDAEMAELRGFLGG